jgi:hypothetical protein
MGTLHDAGEASGDAAAWGTVAADDSPSLGSAAFQRDDYQYISHSGMQMPLLISVLLQICLPDTGSLAKEVQRAI